MNDYILITGACNENGLPGQIGIQKSQIVQWYYANGKLSIILASFGSRAVYNYWVSVDEYNNFLTQITGLPAKDLPSVTTTPKEMWQEYKESDTIQKEGWHEYKDCVL